MTLQMLLVEDDIDVAGVVMAGLRRDGHRVIHLTTGRTALCQVEDTDPDVVLLDLSLPDVDGIAVCAERRRSPPGDGC